MDENKEDVYKDRADLVEALKGQYFCPFDTDQDCDNGTFGEIKSISEEVGERSVKVIFRMAHLNWNPTCAVITASSELPWWVFKKDAKDELTTDLVVSKMIKIERKDFVELARKTFKQSLQVMEDMGIHKEEILR